jgi:hypothetical protein
MHVETIYAFHTSVRNPQGNRPFYTLRLISKIKLSLGLIKHHAMGEWRDNSTIFRPSTRWKLSSQLHAPAALPPEKQSPLPIG